MNLYKSNRNVTAGVVFFIVLFLIVLISSGYLFYYDKGMFWDYLPIICISSTAINLLLLIFYLVRKNTAGYIFLLFFIIFISGIIVSSFFGPFALYNSALENFENKKYKEAAQNYETILVDYPNSKYANDSLKNITLALYFSGDYEDALFYYKEAVLKKIIDDKNLESLKFFADCFLKIAEKNHDLKEYKSSADNYLNYIEYLEKIISFHPDTNEAFIAKYKIPEYLFKAAIDFSKAKEWEKSKQILQQIIEEYPESEYSSKSNEFLFYIHTSSSYEQKNNRNYKEAILEFLNILDLGQDIIESKSYEINHEKEIIFKNIPANILIQSANEQYKKNNYRKALFVYIYILDNFPESIDEIFPNYISSKINLVKETIYEPIEDLKPIGSFKKAGTSKIIFENKTDYNIKIYIYGSDKKIIELEKAKKIETELNSGIYEMAVEFEEEALKPFYGEINLEEGSRYLQTFKTISN